MARRRSLVGLLTAASVLLCNIYCACGSFGNDSAAEQRQLATTSVPAKKKSHCPAPSQAFPSHQSLPVKNQHAPEGRESGDGTADYSPPCSEHPNNRNDACEHCQPIVIAPGAPSFTASSYFLDLVPIALPEIAGDVVARPSASWVHLHGDLSPPACSTLLGLHCALVL